MLRQDARIEPKCRTHGLRYPKNKHRINQGSVASFLLHLENASELSSRAETELSMLKADLIITYAILQMKPVKLGFVPLHRVPFDERWGIELKKRVVDSLSLVEGLKLVYPDDQLIEGGLVKDDADAQKVIELFKKESVQGVVIGTVTFGEELAGASIAEAFKGYPLAIFGTKEPEQLPGGFRRSDSFCGTLSLASALRRRKIPFVYLGLFFPEEDAFRRSVETFARATSAVSAFRGARIGLLGPKPSNFETVTINEAKMAELFHQRVINVTLLEVVETAKRLKDDDPDVLEAMKAFKDIDTSSVPKPSLVKIAKLETVFRRLVKEKGFDGLAVRCWNELERYYGVVPCFAMGRLTDSGIMTACESDVYGTLSMMLQYFAGLGTTPPHFVDLTIAHPQDPNVFLAWHCGNAPPSLACENCPLKIDYHSILYGQLGKENSFGTLDVKLKPGVVTITRLNEYDGEFKLLITKGEIVDMPGEFKGSWSWVRVSDLDKLYRTLIDEGFVHHYSVIHGDYVDALKMACDFLGIKAVVVRCSIPSTL